MFGIANSSSKFIIGLCALVWLTACGNQQATYPECYYDTVESMAEVIDMRPHPDGEGRIAVVLDFKASVLALDDQELGALKDLHIDHDFIERNNIELNNQYEVVVSELQKGECETKLTVAFSHAFE